MVKNAPFYNAPWYSDAQDGLDEDDTLRLAGSFGFGTGLAQAMGWLAGAGDGWMDGWIDVWWLSTVLTRFRMLIRPTAGGIALGFFALIAHARSMARCGGRGGRGDYAD